MKFHFDCRGSGLLLHPTSLPGGDLGREAFAFADYLAEAGQRWWQMLPVTPPGPPPGNSPYSGDSAFAGSPWLIDVGATPLPNARVKQARKFREKRLCAAFKSFRDIEALKHFARENRAWLDDYALFSALKRAHRNAEWIDWPKDLKWRKPSALARARKDLAEEIAFQRFVQFEFFRQWSALRKHCNDRGVGLIGDIPIFVAHDSCDVWAHPELFLLDKNGKPKVVTGCPPDDFNADGQKWNHPHYDWRAHRETRFMWWIDRFAMTMKLFDGVRIDHFLGFCRAWAIPVKAKTARRGQWLSGPGAELFVAVKKKLGRLPVIAEDLGLLTPQAEKLRDFCRFPGMRIMQCAYGDGGDYHRPENFPKRCVAYSGTHDNETVAGWFKNTRGAERKRALRLLNATPKDIHWKMIRAAMASVADTVIFPVQDVLGLDNKSRMNVPGTVGENWKWQLRPGQLNGDSGSRLRKLSRTHSRNKT